MHRFCNGDIKRFVLLLRKCVYPYKYMDSWERFNEISLPEKKAFYSELYMKKITDKDYAHAQKAFEELELKIQVITTICMFNVIHYCLQMYLKTLETSVLKYTNLILLIFCLCLDEGEKNTEVELELLTDIDVLLMIEKGIRGGIYRYAKANNKCMNNYDRNIESS